MKVQVEFDAAFYDEMYGSWTGAWCGEPNPHLAAEVLAATPGTALDAGCGDGSDAVWLAQHGWKVTATDFSASAIERNRRIPLDIVVAKRITWIQSDLTAWEPPMLYDLVSAHFVHLAPTVRDCVFGTLAACVAPGGMLLIVGHHPSDLDIQALRRARPELLYTAQDVARLLAPDDWVILVEEKRAREWTDPQGRTVIVNDAVFVARRFAAHERTERTP